MRDKKSFFTKNNVLNKMGGNRKVKEIRVDDRKVDALENIVAIAVKDQADVERAQNITDIYSLIKSSATRVGRLSGVFLVTVICYFTYSLIAMDQILGGSIFAVSMLCLISVMARGGFYKCSGRVKEEEPQNNRHRYYNNKRGRRRHNTTHPK